MAAVSFEVIQRYLPQILSVIPNDWRGTTFDNSNLLQREGFSSNLISLFTQKEKERAAGKEAVVTEDDLIALGNAEDYLRVATNFSTLLEFVLSCKANLPPTSVFTFASSTFPLLAVALAYPCAVHLFTGSSPCNRFNESHMETLKLLNVNLVVHCGSVDRSVVGDGEIALLAVEDANSVPSELGGVDGVVTHLALYIYNAERIQPKDILVIRKRLATPVTTPGAESYLQELAGIEVSANKDRATEEEIQQLKVHLQQLGGTDFHEDAQPQLFTAGLPAICTMWLAMIRQGGADVLMCSTAYGGSSQLADIISQKAPERMRKHTFDIQGDAPILPRIVDRLNALEAKKDSLLPNVVLFMESPTNPDMKVPDFEELLTALSSFQKNVQRKLILLVDTTFAPASYLLQEFASINPELVAMTFISLSKSVSRGRTTGGAIVPNHTETAKQVVQELMKVCELLDTGSKPDQLYVLVNNHEGVEERCKNAYRVASEVGEQLQSSVKRCTGRTMSLAFVAPEHAANNVTSSTFSFNLPAPDGATEEENAALAQKFVDLLVRYREYFKPCVSFGQDNALVYATVPATSTQGAIRLEDKAKQAVGGVQLVRLSFPPTIDVERVRNIVDESVEIIYKKN